MQYRRLGRTDVYVSAICLGTMTWGSQNTEEQGHAQMDYAVDQGVTFWDTAELYAVPPQAATYGRTEEIIGTWFKSRGKRAQICLASKVVGYAPGLTWIRNGQTRLDRDNIFTALEASLRRLQTDYIDLYQVHWPDRQSIRFGSRYYQHASADPGTSIEETIDVFDQLIASGKVRFVGVSNETPWGVMRYLADADNHNKTRIVSVQNPYNLLNRTFESGLAEVALHEDCGLLAYSPMAGGFLSGKYLDGACPPGSRHSFDPRASRYSSVNGEAATREYVMLARQHQLDAAQMAIAFTLTQPFMTASIIGATTMQQLKTDIASIDVTLSPDVRLGIEKIAEKYPDPCP